MENKFESIHVRGVILNRGEMFGICCLAVIGLMNIVGSIANHAYHLGKEAKEKEIRRDFKRHMKALKKNKRKES